MSVAPSAPVVAPVEATASSFAAPAADGQGFDRFLVGRWWDAILIGPGATLLVSGALLTLSHLGGRAAAAGASLTFALVILFVGPHYAATYRRAYTSLAVVRAHPWVTLAAPIVLLAAAAAAIRRPTTVGLAYFGLYVAWSGYHYSGQSLGLAMLYPLRQGARLDAREKRLLKLPLYVSWLLSLVGLLRLTIPARSPAHELLRRAYRGPAIGAWVTAVGLGALALSFLAVARVAGERRRRGTPLPWPTYAVLSTQVSWFVAALYLPLVNIALVPVFHSLQYLALTSWHACRGRDAAGPKQFAAYAVALLLLGVLINPGLFLWLERGMSVERALIVGATVTSFVNLHHFLLDGRIWRLRERPVVRSMVA